MVEQAEHLGQPRPDLPDARRERATETSLRGDTDMKLHTEPKAPVQAWTGSGKVFRIIQSVVIAGLLLAHFAGAARPAYAIYSNIRAADGGDIGGRPEVAIVELSLPGEWLDLERQAMKVQSSTTYANTLASRFSWHGTLKRSAARQAGRTLLLPKLWTSYCSNGKPGTSKSSICPSVPARPPPARTP